MLVNAVPDLTTWANRGETLSFEDFPAPLAHIAFEHHVCDFAHFPPPHPSLGVRTYRFFAQSYCMPSGFLSLELGRFTP